MRHKATTYARSTFELPWGELLVERVLFQGEKPAIEIGEHENGADSIKTKAQILQFLKDSFADLRKATGTLDEQNLMNPTKDPWSGNQVPRLMFVTTGISHPWEMYGQMVIYLRMNGIDPYKNR